MIEFLGNVITRRNRKEQQYCGKNFCAAAILLQSQQEFRQISHFPTDFQLSSLLPERKPPPVWRINPALQEVRETNAKGEGFPLIWHKKRAPKRPF
ncbi:hypothetical protein O2N63_00430 [Aliiroseovarius sp. KMU-50]|uniref:Uncharacterized protein n=1 Tax=Aliiroseovarius salicola TaxID=3009082 RepID=A0ABT4VWD6_9RHOB|nr:hypothetical protein [Aliiroseovarius sp. KMU-50]MDA5092555.1 hypothetical protein [Aliiroseovarius sp. KMU-50]